MKRIEEIYREILYQSIENNKNILTQSYLASTLNVSLSIVNLALNPLKRMNAIKVKPRCFHIIDKKKALYYWACIRNVEKDIIYKTRVEKPVRKIESEMNADVIYGAYSAYKFKFKDIPADYSEIYVYSNNIEELKKRFPENKRTPNLFILKRDKNMKKMTITNIFVDLWNIKAGYAKEFLENLDARINKNNS